MSYTASVFRVLIASPADVTDERDIVVRTIQDWNNLNSAERQLVLLPLAWETHTAPEYGRRPQEVINRQIVDQADLLIAVFWGRIGSPTGAADSGTLEEIERMAAKGKPIMLYFSKSKLDPDSIDLAQLGKLREFKAKTFPKALVETFSSQVEFHDKLARQLEIQLRGLLARSGSDAVHEAEGNPTTDIALEFAEGESGSKLGQNIQIRNDVILLEGLDSVPDFSPEEASKGRKAATSEIVYTGFGNNKNYYRELAKYLSRRAFFRPLRLWLKNTGRLGARDVFVDMRISGTDIQAAVEPINGSALVVPRKRSNFIMTWSGLEGMTNDSDFAPAGESAGSDELERQGNDWITHLEVTALQPQREVSPVASLLVGAQKSGPMRIDAKIYADSLAEPIVHTLVADWIVRPLTIQATALLEEAGIKF